MARKKTPSEQRAEAAERPRQAAPPEGTLTSDKLVAPKGKRSLEERQAEAQAKRKKREAQQPTERTIPPTEAAALGEAVADLAVQLVMSKHPNPNFPMALRALQAAERHLRTQWRRVYLPAWEANRGK